MAKDISQLVEAIANCQDPAGRHLLGQELLRTVQAEVTYYKEQNNVVVMESGIVGLALLTWAAMLGLFLAIIFYWGA